jgi:hypothetical protein
MNTTTEPMSTSRLFSLMVNAVRTGPPIAIPSA